MRTWAQLALLVLLAATASAQSPVGSAEEGKPPAPTSLRILAQIDGIDELRISHREALWTHHAWAWPSEVLINDQAWQPKSEPSFRAEEDHPFLDDGVTLAGAKLQKLRGRGQVTLGWQEEGLTVRFDDGPHWGAAIYEVLISFAQVEVAKSKSFFAAREDAPLVVELELAAEIDGADAVLLSSRGASWQHYDAGMPKAVRINEQPWLLGAATTLPLNELLELPDFADLSAARLTAAEGRGVVQLEARAGEVVLRFDDRSQYGAAKYRAKVEIPIPALVLVDIDCEPAAEGAELRVLRYPSTSENPVLLADQRVIGAGGKTSLALAPGEYRFEVQALIQADTMARMIALKTARIKIDSPQSIELKGIHILDSKLLIEGRGGMELQDLGLRSSLAVGDLSWQRSSPSDRLDLVLSADQEYSMRMLARDGDTHAALWLNLPPEKLQRLRVNAEQLTSLGFGWNPGTIRHEAAGLSLVFPDVNIELALESDTRLLTNRRFFEIGYWLQLASGEKVAFHPRGQVLPLPPASAVIKLGGGFEVQASAAILTNEKLGDPNAKQVWSEVSLRDAAGQVMDPGASDFGWGVTVAMQDGSPMPVAPLSAEAIEKLGDLENSIEFEVRYHLPKPTELSLRPQGFEAREAGRVSTRVPAGMHWRWQAYSAKIERALQLIGEIRDIPVDPAYRLELKWWLNSGAVGGHGGFTMPINGLSDDYSWFTPPWAIAHELLHGFGYGHGKDMDRVDGLAQEGFRRFRWYVADHPDFVPEELR